MYVSELGGITDMSSHHCSDNVSIEWIKDNQVFKLYMWIGWDKGTKVMMDGTKVTNHQPWGNWLSIKTLGRLPQKFSYISFKTYKLPLQTSNFGHRNFDSVNQVWSIKWNKDSHPVKLYIWVNWLASHGHKHSHETYGVPFLIFNTRLKYKLYYIIAYFLQILH